jgi:hypothetical protein
MAPANRFDTFTRDMKLRSRILRLLCAAALLSGASACDRRPPHVAATAPAKPTLQLELTPLTPLLPNRRTHVAVDPLGNVYWAQENDRGDDIMFVMGQGDIPRATQLSAANVAAAMGSSGAAGNLQSIAAAASGDIFFYFSGVNGRTALSCFGLYSPKKERIRILLDTDSLASATTMGRSLPLARGTVIADRGRRVWLWVRHTDAWVVFALDASALPPEGPLTLNRAFETVRLNGKSVDLTREGDALCAGPDQTLYWMDSDAAELRQIDADGSATTLRSLAEFPGAVSMPLRDRAGRLIFFAAAATAPASPGAGPNSSSPPPAPTPAPASIATTRHATDITYPALILFKGQEMTAIGRDDILAYTGFPIHLLSIHQLISHPIEDSMFGYDSGSGELLRLHIRAKTEG